MSRRAHPTRRALLILAAFALSLGIAVPSAHAQQPSVTLRLDRQTPLAVLGGETRIEFTVSATNTGDTAVEDISLGVTLDAAVLSRGAFEVSLQPGTSLTPLDTKTKPQEGAIQPGQTRTFEAGMNLADILAVSKTDTRIYPLRIDLRTGDTVVSELRTVVPFFVRTPDRPIAFSLTIELSPPVSFLPDGRFPDDRMETAVAPGGRIAEQLAALQLLAAAKVPVTVALSPVLVDTLVRMSAGYTVGDREVPRGQGGAADAATALTSLRQGLAAASTEVSVYPLTAPSIPAMVSSGLGRDLDQQTTLGDDLVDRELGVMGSVGVVRAPGGSLDNAAVQRLASRGATALIGDAGTVERPPQDQDFAPLPTGAVDRNGGSASLPVILPDPGTQQILASIEDPVLVAQRSLGSLAAVWQEAPVPTEPRGVAVVLSEDLGLPATFWQPFARRVIAAPFLEAVSAEDLLRLVPPGTPAPLAEPSTSVFGGAYTDAIKQERRRIDAVRSMMPGDAPLPDRLTSELLYAESGTFIVDEGAGRGWIDSVHAQTDAVFARATTEPVAFTLTASSGTIPIRVVGGEGPPLNARIELQSAGLRFPDGASQDVRIEGGTQVLQFRVQATGAGNIPVQVVVWAPNDRALSTRTFLVRSTAYNRIALVITVAAALGLVALWIRRLIARRRTS